MPSKKQRQRKARKAAKRKEIEEKKKLGAITIGDNAGHGANRTSAIGLVAKSITRMTVGVFRSGSAAITGTACFTARCVKAVLVTPIVIASYTAGTICSVVYPSRGVSGSGNTEADAEEHQVAASNLYTQRLERKIKRLKNELSKVRKDFARFEKFMEQNSNNSLTMSSSSSSSTPTPMSTNVTRPAPPPPVAKLPPPPPPPPPPAPKTASALVIKKSSNNSNGAPQQKKNESKQLAVSLNDLLSARSKLRSASSTGDEEVRTTRPPSHMITPKNTNQIALSMGDLNSVKLKKAENNNSSSNSNNNNSSSVKTPLVTLKSGSRNSQQPASPFSGQRPTLRKVLGVQT